MLYEDVNGDIQTEARFSYDAWGQPRNPDSIADYTINHSAFNILGRGYTGHEHLLEHQIINMNGRIYDPIVGMFMQPDNYIHNPTDFKSYDRYTYCFGNPFKYTDPSGENPDEEVPEGDVSIDDAYFCVPCSEKNSLDCPRKSVQGVKLEKKS